MFDSALFHKTDDFRFKKVGAPNQTSPLQNQVHTKTKMPQLCVCVSSIYWTLYKFFASQSLHNRKILKKKIRRSKRQRNFCLFYFASQES